MLILTATVSKDNVLKKFCDGLLRNLEFDPQFFAEKCAGTNVGNGGRKRNMSSSFNKKFDQAIRRDNATFQLLTYHFI